MGLFTDLYNTVAKFFRQSDEPVIGDASKAVATNRLKLVLMQDRTNLTPRVLEQMRSELVDLLSKYLEMDKELLELNFEQEGDQVALMLSIPVIRAKDEEEIEKALNAENKNTEEDICDDEDFEEDEVDEFESKNSEEIENSSEEQIENSEEKPKPRKRRTKKVSTPEGFEGNSEHHEENHQEVVIENNEG